MKHLKRFTCMAMAAAMALSLAACGGTPSDAGGSGSEAGSGDQKTIVVGTSNFTEVNILGEIYTELRQIPIMRWNSVSACPARPCALTPWSRAASICLWSILERRC